MVIKSKTTRATTKATAPVITRRKRKKNVAYAASTVQGILAIMTNSFFMTDDHVKRCALLTKKPFNETKRLMAKYSRQGPLRTTTLRDDATGQYIATAVPVPATGKIMKPQDCTPLLTAVSNARRKQNLALDSILEDGTGHKALSFEVKVPAANKRGYTIRHAEIYAALEPYFSKARALLVQLRITMGQDTPGLPTVPPRIFCNIYPAGNVSGVNKHVDAYTAYGAVTLALTTDEQGGSFFTTLADELAHVQDWPLQAGHAVAILPSMTHGVHAIRRKTDRVTLNLFY